MNSHELVRRCQDLTYRQLDYWCSNQVFSSDKVHPGRSAHRDFTEQDLYIAQVIARISHAFDAWSGRRGGFVAIYREAADQIRAGATSVQITLAPGIQLTATMPTTANEADDG